MSRSRDKLLLLLLVLAFLAGTRDAWAYIDPGAGSYVLQIVVASLVGGLFALKAFWGRIREAFSRRAEDDEKEEEVDK